MNTLNKLTNFEKAIIILTIINKYGSYDEPISSAEIKDIFQKQYNSKLDIRTIESAVSSFNTIQEDYEIETIKSKPNKYYFSVKPGLDLGEAKAIVDLIYSSHYFTQVTKNNFIEQMKGLFNVKDAEILNKTLNTHICRNEDSRSFYDSFAKISKAIHNKEKISFMYLKPTYELNTNTNLKKKYCPIETSCENNTFYLYCYDEETGKDRNYRIDYIHNVILTGEKFIPNQELCEKLKSKIINSTAAFDPDDYPTITFSFEKNLYANMIDKFGNYIKKDITILDDNHYSVSINKCPISPTFYGWLIGFNGKIQIISPEKEVIAFKNFLVNNFIN